MKYISTRGGAAEGKSASYVILNGIADDGGLYFPTEIPKFDADFLASLSIMDYAERAAKILAPYLTDYTYDELYESASAAYSKEKFGEHAVPLAKLDKEELYLLELWHGPTSAFKDMALQIMPRLLSKALKKSGSKETALILVATSGDTGKAALEGYADVEGVKMAVFYPCDGVSSIQKRQMATQRGSNVEVFAVEGNFDDCQSSVKEIFGDSALRAKLKEKGMFFSSANSINFGRLAPQVAYYISAYCDLIAEGAIENGEKVNITVPTGNFGNILAAYMAKKAGLPVGKLICASNMNNVLTDFFNTGVYDRRRKFYTTASPSMDILISSNLERLLYLAAGSEKCREYMEALKNDGVFKVDEETMETLREDFAAFYCDEADTKATIKDVYTQYGYLCDPHTAVGIYAARKYRESGDNAKMLAASTASPFKFTTAVCEALGIERLENEFDALRLLSETAKVQLPENLAQLEEAEIRFTRIIKREEMPSVVEGL